MRRLADEVTQIAADCLHAFRLWRLIGWFAEDGGLGCDLGGSIFCVRRPVGVSPIVEVWGVFWMFLSSVFGESKERRGESPVSAVNQGGDG